MNLMELNAYKKNLELKRYLCGAMAFLTFTTTAYAANGNYKFAKKSADDLSHDVYSSCQDGIAVASTTDLCEVNLINRLTTLPEVEARSIKSIEGTELTYAGKMRYIMERDGYTYNELDSVLAGCVAESYGDGNCYDECYDIASVFNNRIHDAGYVADVNRIFGGNAGRSIYYQFIAPNQFSVYSHGSYRKYLGRIDLLGYQGAIDMLYSGVPSHNFLNFNNVPPRNRAYVQFNSPSGNYFSNAQRPENIIGNGLARG